MNLINRLMPGHGSLAYMRPPKEQTHITEEYVSSPPALIIVDEVGAVWTLGLEQTIGPRGEYAWPVFRNGLPVGEYASRIERRGGKIRIFTTNGFKRWSGRSFV